MTAGKTIAFTRGVFVGKTLSLPFNALSRYLIAFLPRSKPLLILCLQSSSTVILEPEKIKSVFLLDGSERNGHMLRYGEVILAYICSCLMNGKKKKKKKKKSLF